MFCLMSVYHGEGNKSACLRPVRHLGLMTMPLQPFCCWEVLEAKRLTFSGMRNKEHMVDDMSDADYRDSIVKYTEALLLAKMEISQ